MRFQHVQRELLHHRLDYEHCNYVVISNSASYSRCYKIFCVNEKYGPRIFYFIYLPYIFTIYQMKKIMKEKNQIVVEEVLNKEFMPVQDRIQIKKKLTTESCLVV